MDYLTRSLQFAAQNSAFRFHPMCKNLKLISLCFADDLLVFCKGSLSSVQVIKGVLREFSSVTGLHLNENKSQIFFGGISEAEKRILAAEMNLSEGIFPLKYLGVPMRPTKWKHEDCDVIIQKIKRNLHTWASRHLSYAGRMQLIHSVCLPKALGGLRFRNGQKWNHAILAKFIWAISEKVDLLWVKWINSIYLKGADFWSYKVPPDTSWYWRKLCSLRGKYNRDEIMAAGVSGKFCPARIYSNSLHYQQVDYYKAVWCKLSLPKHRFLLWQVVNTHLLTLDNLCRFKVLAQVCDWLDGNIWPAEFDSWRVWLASRKSEFIDQVAVMILVASVYSTWRNRNNCIFELSSKSAVSIASEI
ncbi:uncharacterized protein LOC133779229 [Humulus lupulus]|uniref:uncharacterized protein LOC133779229 n=1 Tax=Humulus lupulus TaxID=3486 RepID=UPI002B40DB38|nr:uncharacterized protein LOC133779229 [Humulus lupulus]